MTPSQEFPLVTLVTVNFNQTAVTRDLLLSLRKITYPSIEIIVVDNGSSNSSVESLVPEFPEIHLIVTGKNLGFAGGNNVGIKAGKGDFFLLINNDTEVEPGFLEPLVETLQKETNAGLASPKIVFYDRNEQIQYAGSSRISSFTGRGIRIGYLETDKGQYDKIYRTELGHGACLLFSRAVLDKVGLMPEMYFLYYEEHDFTEKAKKAGFKVYYVGTSKIYHKESISTGRNSSLKTYYLARNRILFARRNSSGPTLVLVSIFFILVAIPKNVLQYILARDKVNLRAYVKGVFWNMTGDDFMKKFSEVRKENPKRGAISILMIYLSRLLGYAWRVLMAKWYLRGCTTGKLVTAKGSPLIISKGEIIIGNRVVLWSVFDRTKLSVRALGRLEIGDHTRINGAHIAVKHSVKIGKNVRIAPYTLIMDSDFHDIQEHASEGRSAPIVIEDNVWIASRATILKGVTIGEGSVICAGAVVTKSVPARAMVGGVPARIIRMIEPTARTI